MPECQVESVACCYLLLSVVTIFYDDMTFSRFFPESRLFPLVSTFSPSLDFFPYSLDFFYSSLDFLSRLLVTLALACITDNAGFIN